MIKYNKSSLEENEHFVNDYINSLSSRFDDFLEEHILQATVYSIHINGEHSGYFAIYDKSLLTQFFISKNQFRFAQAIFADVLKTYEIKSAFVPTCDETLLSLCLDQHCKINLQAYFFVEGHAPVKEANYPREFFTQATMEDLNDIITNTGDFIDKHEKRIKAGKLYILREAGTFLGLGLIEDNIIMKGCQGIGMYTHENHRNKGVGRSIIMHLKDICHENGAIPLPGCWYYNHNSKKTLESAGFISKTRLLNVEFNHVI